MPKHRCVSDLFLVTAPVLRPRECATATLVVLRKELPFAGYSVVKEPSILPRALAVASSTHQISCRSRVGPAPRNVRATDNRRPEPPGPANRTHRRADASERLVENTGLEPVTSWLQTRRSPS